MAGATGQGHVQGYEKQVESWSKQSGVGECVHHDSFLSLLLFIFMLEALSREFHTGCPWEVLYADDL